VNETRLAGKSCLITGATGGIGVWLCREMAARGCRLFLTGTSAGALAETARCSDLEGAVDGWVAADLGEEGAVSSVVTAVGDVMEKVDVIIHSAGVFPVEAVEDLTAEGIQRCLAVNLQSFMILSAALAPAMADRGWGRIVAIGSSSAYAGFARTSVYCASKHGLLGFCRALNDELRSNGVRVITVSPGSVKTEMGRLVEGQDFSTFIEPEEVARAVVQAMELDGSMAVDELRLNRMVIQ